MIAMNTALAEVTRTHLLSKINDPDNKLSWKVSLLGGVMPTYSEFDALSFSERNELLVAGNGSSPLVHTTDSVGDNILESLYASDGTFDWSSSQQSTDIFMSPDGHNVYIIDRRDARVVMYTLYTNYDLSNGASHTGSTDIHPTDYANIPSFMFSSDGMHMYVFVAAYSELRKFAPNSNVPWRFYSANHNQSYNFGFNDIIALTMFNDSHFIMLRNGHSYAYEYSLPNLTDMNTMSLVRSIPLPKTTFRTIAFSPDGLQVLFGEETSNSVYLYMLDFPYDLTTIDSSGQSDHSWLMPHLVKGLHYAEDRSRIYISSDYLAYQYEYVPDNSSIPDLGELSSVTPTDGSAGSPFLQHNGDTASLNSSEISLSDFVLNLSGDTGYFVGVGSDRIYEQSLYAPWDLQESEPSGKSIYVGTQETSPAGLDVSSNGLYFYLVGFGAKTVYRYDLTIPGDMDSLVASGTDSLYVGDKDFSPVSVRISEDGKDLFVLGSSGRTLHRWVLGTPFLLASSVYHSSFSMPINVSNALSFTFRNNYKELYVSGNTGIIARYNFDIPKDFTTGYFIGNVYDYSSLGNDAVSLLVGDSDSKLYISSAPSDNVHTLDFNDSTSLKGSEVKTSMDLSSWGTDLASIEITRDGLHLYVLEKTVNQLRTYTLTNPWDTDINALDAIAYGFDGEIVSPIAMAVDATGNKIFLADESTSILHRYTMVIQNSAYIEIQESVSIELVGHTVQDIKVNPEGTILIALYSNGELRKWSLSSWDDISALTDVGDSLLLGNTFSAFTLSDDGTELYASDTESSTIRRYLLDTAWDISAYSVDTNFLYTGADIRNVSGILVRPATTDMLVLGNDLALINGIVTYSIFQGTVQPVPAIRINLGKQDRKLVERTDTPITWFSILYDSPIFSDSYGLDNGISFVGSVGAIGSGADIEMLNPDTFDPTTESLTLDFDFRYWRKLWDN